MTFIHRKPKILTKYLKVLWTKISNCTLTNWNYCVVCTLLFHLFIHFLVHSIWSFTNENCWFKFTKHIYILTSTSNFDLNTEASIGIGRKSRMKITIVATKRGLTAMMVLFFLMLNLRCCVISLCIRHR